MGLPKKLTEKQMKFAHEIVTNEGRKTATECAVDAGFESEFARQYASKLQNPKLYPLVVKYIEASSLMLFKFAPPPHKIILLIWLGLIFK